MSHEEIAAALASTEDYALALQHGGNLTAASRRYGIEPQQWLDLSTGINPCHYPIPHVPDAIYQQLPQQDEAHADSVKAYYQAEYCAEAAGSQPFIEALPQLRSPCQVALPDIAYREHAHHWSQHGHRCYFYDGFNPLSLAELIEHEKIDVAVVVNPCNPTAASLSTAQLLQWRDILAARGGWLIVDEAFMDLSPAQSLAPHSDLSGLIVLRSIGKFFGLAGIRVGYALSNKHLHAQLSQAVARWSVAGPSKYIAGQALADAVWQQQARRDIVRHADYLKVLLQEKLAATAEQTYSAGLFISIRLEKAQALSLYEALAAAAVLTRYWPLGESVREECRGQTLLRFGLLNSDDPQACEKLLQALASAGY